MNTNVVILCVDGSDLSTRALAAGLALVDPAAEKLIVTVIAEDDHSLVVGSGFAGPTMSQAEFEENSRQRRAAAEEVVRDAAHALGLDDATTRVIEGQAGRALCDLAAEVGARGIVIGSRGHGGFKRAILGSVSDFVVRNAPCPVVVTTAPEGDPA